MNQQQLNMLLQDKYQTYLQFCHINGLVVGHPNSINLFYQQYYQKYYQPQPQPYPQPIFQSQPQPYPRPIFQPQPQPYPQPIFQPQPQPQPYPQPQPQTVPQVPPQQQSSFHNNNSSYLPDSNNLPELIPRSDQVLYANREKENLPNYINVIFKATSGLNVIVTVDKTASMYDMFKLYMKRLGLPEKHLSGNLQFLHAGVRLNPFDNIPVYSLFKTNQSIVVFDQRNIVGASDLILKKYFK